MTFLSDTRKPEVRFSSLLICPDATKFVWLSVFTLRETICPKFCSKSRLKCAKSPLPVDARPSKTSLLLLSIIVEKQTCLSLGTIGPGGTRRALVTIISATTGDSWKSLFSDVTWCALIAFYSF